MAAQTGIRGLQGVVFPFPLLVGPVIPGNLLHKFWAGVLVLSGMGLGFLFGGFSWGTPCTNSLGYIRGFGGRSPDFLLVGFSWGTSWGCFPKDRGGVGWMRGRVPMSGAAQILGVSFGLPILPVWYDVVLGFFEELSGCPLYVGLRLGHPLRKWLVWGWLLFDNFSRSTFRWPTR